MQALVANFTGDTPGISAAENNSLNAQGQYWAAPFLVTYAIEFLCLSVAKLLVLHRMADFAVAKGDGLSRRLAVGGRVVIAAVVLGTVVGLCGNVAAAVLFKQVGDLSNAAAAAFAANNTQSANAIVVQAFQKNNVASGAASVQQFCEVAVLLIIILAFAVVGLANARLVSSVRPARYERRMGCTCTQAYSASNRGYYRHCVRHLHAARRLLHHERARQRAADRWRCLPHLLWHTVQQLVDAHSVLAAIHARVPADDCAHLVAPGAACCAVGHDQRAYAGAHEVEQRRTVGDARQIAAGVKVGGGSGMGQSLASVPPPLCASACDEDTALLLSCVGKLLGCVRQKLLYNYVYT